MVNRYDDEFDWDGRDKGPTTGSIAKTLGGGIVLVVVLLMLISWLSGH